MSENKYTPCQNDAVSSERLRPDTDTMSVDPTLHSTAISNIVQFHWPNTTTASSANAIDDDTPFSLKSNWAPMSFSPSYYFWDRYPLILSSNPCKTTTPSNYPLILPRNPAKPWQRQYLLILSLNPCKATTPTLSPPPLTPSTPRRANPTKP